MIMWKIVKWVYCLSKKYHFQGFFFFFFFFFLNHFVLYLLGQPARAATKAMAYYITRWALWPDTRKSSASAAPLAKRSPRYLTNSFHPAPKPNKRNHTSPPSTHTSQDSPYPTQGSSAIPGVKV